MDIKELLKSIGRGDWNAVGQPVPETKLVTNTLTGTTEPQPTGRYVLTISDGKGNNQQVILRQQTGEAETAAGPQTRVIGWTVEEAPEALPKTPAGEAPELAGQRVAETGRVTEQTTQLQAERAQRERNQAAGQGYLSDAEVAKLSQEASQQGLTADQLAQRRREFEVSSQQRGREIDIQAANSAIAAANSRLAQERQIIEAQVEQGRLSLDEAKLQYQKAKDDADREIDQQRLAIQSAQQASTSAYQQGTLAQQQAQLAETTRSNIATEGLRTSEQARAAAGDILSAGQQAAQTGAGLLNQRVQSGTSLLNSLTGMAGSSKMLSAPAGLGEGLVSGVQGYVTGLGGGQGVYDTAAKAVQNLLPGGAGNPMASTAYAVLGQLLERYQQQTGQPHPVASQVANMAPQQQQPQSFTSPQAGGGGVTINIGGEAFRSPTLAGAGPTRGPLMG